MSAQTTPATEPAPAPQGDATPPVASSTQDAAPAADAEFLADVPESEAAAPAAAEDGKPADKPDGEDADFLAETENDETESKADAPGDAKPEGESEAYQPFTLPENVQIDEAVLAEATPIFKELGLDQDGAQKLVSFYAAKTQDALASYHQQLAAAHAETLKTWTNELTALPQYKGKALTEAKARVVDVLSKIGTPELRKLIGDGKDGYGLIRNPVVFTFLDAIGTKLSPDSLVRDDAGAPIKDMPKRPADVMYS